MFDDFNLEKPPFSYDDGKARLFGATDGARLIADAAYPSDLAAMRLTRLNRQGIIHTTGMRKKPSGKEQAMFGLHDLLVAKTLFALSDLGIERPATYRAASLALYGWPPGAKQQKFPHPIIAAAVGTLREESWSALTLDSLKHPTTGQIYIVGEVRLDITKAAQPIAAAMKLVDEGWMIGASIVLELPPVIGPVFDRLALLKQAH